MSGEIKSHLDEAFKHLNEALNLSIQSVKQDKSLEKPIASQWETFLGGFFRNLKTKGKEHKLNLLSIVSFTKMLKG
ncbi:hypothetical protein [Tumebacillus flagellatus]|uniref:Uncharacterized protein n=1 Tax=Tumebacillus flagellatus TaxID=1157490 RepID=A0A074M8A9_9BACL|nr:hypothetical protein [Tumebacillus flagellatus]KEO82217.1 hypothetical protein EL26_16330 [Tumebacillus flagellatus]